MPKITVSRIDAITPKDQFDYVVVNTEMTLDDALIHSAIEKLPNWLRGGGKGWVICENQPVIDLVTSRCQSLGFDVEVMQYTDPAAMVDPEGFPQTLQIDPFTPAAKAIGNDAAIGGESGDDGN